MVMQYKNKSTGIYQAILAVIMAMLFLADPVQAQRSRRSPYGPAQPGGRLTLEQQIRTEAEGIRAIAMKILQEYVLLGKQLSPEEIAKIKETLKQAKRYSSQFIPEDKAYLKMVQAYVAFYAGDMKTAFRQIDAAIRDATSSNSGVTDFSDSALLMAFLSKDYDRARKMLKKRHAGWSAAENVKLSWMEKPKTPKLSFGSQPGDPNSMGTTSITRKPSISKQKRNSNSNSSSNDSILSGWSIRRPTPPPAPAKKTRPSSTSSKRPAPASKSKDRGPTLGVGMSLGPMAPVDPTYIGQPPATPPQQGRRGQFPGAPGSRSGYRAGRANNILNLQVDYMPYSDLGKQIHKIQVRELNGSYFQFEPGKGQVLCAFMWTLPTDTSSSKRNSGRRGGSRRVRNYMPSGPGPGPGYGYDNPAEYEMQMGQGYGGASFMNRGKNALPAIMQVNTDLASNAEQFKYLFSKYAIEPRLRGMGGQVAFLGINLNPAFRLKDVANMLLENAWPWANCIYDDDVNRKSLSDFSGFSPVMMIVGTSGNIRYMGPVGGILPQLVLKQELQSAVTAGGTIPNIPENTIKTPAHGRNKGLLGRFFGWNKPGKTAGNPGNQALEPAKSRSGNQTTGQNSKKAPSLEEKPSILQARNMLQTVYTYKNLMPNKALDTCDEILKRWPQSLEADKAKQIILDIQKRRPRVKEERARLGKWTGE